MNESERVVLSNYPFHNTRFLINKKRSVMVFLSRYANMEWLYNVWERYRRDDPSMSFRPRELRDKMTSRITKASRLVK